MEVEVVHLQCFVCVFVCVYKDMIGWTCSRHVRGNTFIKDFNLNNLMRSGCLGDLGIDWRLISKLLSKK